MIKNSFTDDTIWLQRILDGLGGGSFMGTWYELDADSGFDGSLGERKSE